MAGRLINGVKYVAVFDGNNRKKESLEDNVYFTLRDFFQNCDINDCLVPNNFNHILTNGIKLYNRDKRFEYNYILYNYNSDFTKNLYNWLKQQTKYKDSLFDFSKEEDDGDVNLELYMKYDEWWEQLLVLVNQLEEQLKNHEIWRAEDTERDSNRQAELENEL